MGPIMTGVLLFHIALGLALVGSGGQPRRRVWVFALLSPLSILGAALFASDGRVDWVPQLDLELVFRLDGYARVFLGIIGGAGLAIFWHASRYFTPSRKATRFAGTMVLFAGAMAGLVTSDHLLGIFLFWEVTTITSYLLIGYSDEKAQARVAALQAALVTGAGGLAMLGGLVLLGREAGTFLVSEIITNPPSASLAWVLILVGAMSKSAQFPLHGWLPAAMAAPTPASAFLHSATMVKAGIFLVGRLGPAATETSWWQPTVMVIGFSTMLVGGWAAIRQTDLKLLLAHGTVSQLGFLFVLFGSGIPKALYGGLALIIAHAAFKATLFMVVGSIDLATGTRDLRALSGLARSMPGLFTVAALASASMAAIPLSFGFAAKEAAFDGLSGTFALPVAALASVLTVVYTGRFLIGGFGPAAPESEAVTGRPVTGALLAAPGILAGLGLVIGLAPGLVADIVESASGEKGKLVLWPGFVEPLWWSLASLAIGLVLLRRGEIVDFVQERLHSSRIPKSDRVFAAGVSGLVASADRSTSLIQNGSLPSYVTVILATVLTVPAVVALRGGVVVGVPAFGGPVEALLGALVVASAAGLIWVRGRFAAVILLGGVGYGVAGLFALAGGPDLALTQLLVETLVIGFFALVFRRLPAAFPKPIRRPSRVIISVAVGLFVFAVGLVMTGGNPATEVADGYLTQALPDAAGRNVVNVVLVDFRALDTLGEITVLVIAALGAAGLIRPLLRSEDGQP